MEKSEYAYIAAAGETFDLVAQMVYKNSYMAADLMRANPALCHKAVFTGGEQVRLVVRDGEMTDRYGHTIRTTAPWKEG